MCVKLSMLQERDYGDPALLQVRPYYPFRVRRHLYQFVPKSLVAVFFSCPSRDIICDKMIFSHGNPSRVKNA